MLLRRDMIFPRTVTKEILKRMKYFLKYQANGIETPQYHLVADAQNITLGRDIMRFLLGHEEDGTEIREEVLIAAVRNEVCGIDILEEILEHPVIIKVTEEILNAVAGFRYQKRGPRIMKLATQ
jgi:hypothetical protein